jgi:ketosteroid isomerase-like protein
MVHPITMRKIYFSLFIACLIFSAATAQSKDETSIRTSLAEQMAAWNAGDLDRFMQTYWQSDSLMFIGKSGITYGWQATLNNYKKGYPDTAAMGKLDFNIIEVKRLSVLYFSVVGKWHLARSIGDVSGHFTLLFKKVKNKWVIISDHSS